MEVDATGPAFEVTLSPAPVRPAASAGTTWGDVDPAYVAAFRRDEKMVVTVTSSASDVNSASVRVFVKIGSGASQSFLVAQSQSACATGIGWCGSVEVPLWDLQMPAFRDTVTANVEGRDAVGNTQTASMPASGKVTRWKWVHARPGGPKIRAAPAIASDGTVVFGTESGGIAGEVVAVSNDGTLRWAKSTGAVVSSPAIGSKTNSPQTVYVAPSDGTTTALHSLDITNGAAIPGGLCAHNVSGTSEAAVAIQMTKLSSESVAVETASALFNGAKIILMASQRRTLHVCAGDYRNRHCWRWPRRPWTGRRLHDSRDRRVDAIMGPHDDVTRLEPIGRSERRNVRRAQ